MVWLPFGCTCFGDTVSFKGIIDNTPPVRVLMNISDDRIDRIELYDVVLNLYTPPNIGESARTHERIPLGLHPFSWNEHVSG
ncbi:MAG: hypothetical protein Q8O19_04145, partial [Rectinemataceae bacterium]|nr:hypothetical protein [Rectinemataceae bacterium]